MPEPASETRASDQSKATLVQVHAYVYGPKGRTAYLAELRSGQEVVVVDPQVGGDTSVLPGSGIPLLRALDCPVHASWEPHASCCCSC